MDEIEQDTTGFMPVAEIAQITGIMAVVLTGIWMGHFRGGMAWQSDPKLEFNWHPMLMVIGMVFLYGNGKALFLCYIIEIILAWPCKLRLGTRFCLIYFIFFCIL